MEVILLHTPSPQIQHVSGFLICYMWRLCLSRWMRSCCGCTCLVTTPLSHCFTLACAWYLHQWFISSSLHSPLTSLPWQWWDGLKAVRAAPKPSWGRDSSVGNHNTKLLSSSSRYWSVSTAGYRCNECIKGIYSWVLWYVVWIYINRPIILRIMTLSAVPTLEHISCNGTSRVHLRSTPPIKRIDRSQYKYTLGRNCT